MVTIWTDDPLQDGTEPNPTRVRSIHVDELRVAINDDIARRGESLERGLIPT